MSRLMALIVAFTALAALVGADTADARRFGGGRSLGAQRQITPAPATPRAAPSSPTSPTQAAPARTAGAGAASGGARWLGPLAGLAAGLGLAALFSHLGLSEALGNFLILALLVGGGFLLVRMLFSRRGGPPSRPLQYAGTGAPDASSRVEPHLVGAAGRFEPVTESMPPGAAAAPVGGKFPPGFDPAPFIEQSKRQFRKLQAAYDTGNRSALSEVLTPEMFAEASRDLEQRGAHVPTEVVQLDADVLEVATEGDRHWMSVHFRGLLREDGTVLPREFDEIWNLVKPVDDSTGWMLAGIQQTNEMA
jgi:predicted lipid-binding transport protein (Tim44 family)